MDKKIYKGVIPCAGLGTRFLPFTKAVPKELIAIVDKPALQYIVEEVVNAGINDIMIIISSQKMAISEHFGNSQSLVDLLLSRGKNEDAQIVKSISKIANITYAYQEAPTGSAGAVNLAKDFVGGQPFALLFGDDLVYSKNSNPTYELCDAYNKYGKTTIGVQEVLRENISKYSSISIKEIVDDIFVIDDIIEKPNADNVPSLYAGLGRYILSPEIFDYIEKTPVGVGGEIGITDTFQIMAKEGKCIAKQYSGKRYDTGNKLSYMQASVEYALRHKEIGDDFKKYLKELIKEL